MTEIPLVEVDRDKVFKDGEIVRQGNYWIGWDLTFGIHIPTFTKQEAEILMKQISDNQEKVRSLDSLEYHLSKRDDGLWYVVGINETGGMEFSTWFGYEEQLVALDNFQRIFHYPVYEPDSMRDYPYPPMT